GRPYVDGGVRSGTHADAAAGYERVLVIACGPEGPSPCGPWPDVAVEALRAGGSSAEVVVPDSPSQQAFATNSLSLAPHAPPAEDTDADTDAADTPAARPVRLTRSAKGEGGIAFTRTGDLLFVSARPDADATDLETAQLWVLPANGGEARPLTRLACGVGGVL